MVRDINEIITDPDSAEELFYYGDYFTKLKILNCSACPPEIAYLAVTLCKRGPVTYYDLDLVMACNIWRVVGVTEEAFNYLYKRIKLQEMILAFCMVKRRGIEEPSTKVFYPTDVAEWSSLVGLIAHPYSWPHVCQQNIYCKDGLLLKYLSHDSVLNWVTAGMATGSEHPLSGVGHAEHSSACTAPTVGNLFVSYSKDSFYPKEVSELILMGLALNPKVTNSLKQRLLEGSNSLKLRHYFEVNPVSSTSERRLQEILDIYQKKYYRCKAKEIMDLSKIVIAHALSHPNGKGVLLSACLGGYNSLVKNLAEAVAKHENPWQALIHYNDPELIPF